jgi:hypothetical protein
VYGGGEAEGPFSVVPIVSCLRAISLRWSLARDRADAYQHMVPSWPGTFKVQDRDAPWWCPKAAEADGKQERSCPLAAETSFPLSDDVCVGRASVGFTSKRTVVCNDARLARLSTVRPLALAEGA